MVKVGDIKYILFGVQFNHSFKLLDCWGEIADDIIYNTEYFSGDFFSSISTQYTTERSLVNRATGDFLTLSSNSLIFKYYLKDSKEFNKEFDYFCERINKYLVPKILSAYKLVVRRVGVIYACEMTEPDLDWFKSKYFKDNIQGITDFRFAQKGTTLSGALWKETNDYINKVFTVGTILLEDDMNCKGVTYDYQLHYKPIRQDIRDNCPDFLKMSLSGFQKDIMNREEKKNGQKKK